MQFHWPLIGHEPIRAYFTKAFGSGRTHHAYLFLGPAQVGKATFAKMLAQTLLCDAQKGTLPCGRCRACEAYSHGAHPDFAALTSEDEHLGIEEARAFISTLSTKPLLGPLRIGIIEEAQRLTAEASNALLKTIEEPPPSVVLFLISSEPLLPTIMSRCQRVQFGLVPELIHEDGPAQEELAQVLEKDQGARLLWIIEQYAGKGRLADQRQRARGMITALQRVLRPRLAEDWSVALMLKRTLEADNYLAANVDPKSVMEYVLLT